MTDILAQNLIEKGVIETYDTLPETALVKMMWLTKHESNKVEELMSKNLVGELSNIMIKPSTSKELMS